MEMSFEEKCKRLEEIVNRLDDQNLTLAEGTKLFEEGVALSKECYKMLENSKGKIVNVKKELNSLANGEV